MSVASNIKIASKYFRTNDGVRLHYLEAGGGKPLVLVHGFSQTAEQFKFQIEGLADRYRVITLDLRGHGESEKPNFGLKIHRLAEDLREALIAAKATMPPCSGIRWGARLSGPTENCSAQIASTRSC
jgi:pimeloyl-ACP methyl ester carboxylesterase